MVKRTEDASATRTRLEVDFDALIGEPAADPQEEPLWHYTTAEGFKGIIENQRIRATHYAFTNDSTEMRDSERLVGEVARQLAHGATGPRKALFEAFLHEYQRQSLTRIADIYLASFAADDGDQLSQWWGYGARGAGYALGFQPLPVPTQGQAPTDSTGLLIRAEYNPERFAEHAAARFEKIAKLYDEHPDEEALSVAVSALLRQAGAMTPRFKNSYFLLENEWRYVVVPKRARRGEPVNGVEFRIAANGLVPYVEIALTTGKDELLPLIGVVVGPASDRDERLLAARMFLSAKGYDPSLVRSSGAPYRA